MSLMLAVGAAQAATATLPAGAVLIDEKTAKSDPARLALDTGAVLERVAAGDDAGALVRLRQIADPLARELTASRVIASLSANGGGAKLLDALAAEPAWVFRRHDETRANWFLPVFDIAGQAQSLRQMRARRAHALALRAELLADPKATAKRDADWPEAIALLAPQDIDRVAAMFLAKGADPDPRAVVALATRSKRADIWERALDIGEPVDVMPLFEQVDERLAPEAAKAWVGRAAHDARYASAAVFASARLPGDALHAWLDDADLGATAATAIAQRDGDGFVAHVDALASKTASAERLQHLALALRLIGTPAARERLRQLAEDPRLPAHVRTELQR